MKKYKKLFDIRYNNKLFTIFLDNNHRRTFLEKRKCTYHYPEIEDFLVLNKIYNTYSLIDKAPLLTFSEKVKVKAITLAIVSLVNVTASTDIKAEIKDNQLILSENQEVCEETDRVVIQNVNELDQLLGDKNITVEEARKAIDNNDLIPEKVKNAAHEALNNMIERYPSIDLRIFYYNMVDLSYEELPVEILQEKRHTEATFDPSNKVITSHPNVTKKTLTHEINHTFYSFYFIDGKTQYMRRLPYAQSLTEAMTEAMTVEKIEAGTYQEERYFLDYLCSLVDFKIEDYYEKGISDLITKLETKYPDVDIKFIISSLDSRNQSRLYKDVIIIEEPPIQIIEELYKTCQTNIDMDCPYRNFANFAQLILNTCSQEEMIKYLKNYNELLQKHDYVNIISSEIFEHYYKTYKNISFLVTKNSDPLIIKKEQSQNLSEGLYSYYEIDEEGNKTNEIKLSSYHKYNIVNIDIRHLWQYLFKYAHQLGAEDYWKTLIEEEQIISPHLYQTIPIYYNGQIILKDYLDALNIKITLSDNNKLGFIILKGDNKLLQTRDSYQYETNQAPLDLYRPYDLDYMDKFDLTQYLTYEYLKESEGEFSHLFTNLSLRNDQFVIVPDYKIKILSDNEEFITSMRGCYLQKNNLNFSGTEYVWDLYSNFMPINIFGMQNTSTIQNRIYLEQVLESTGNLNLDTLEYTFTIEELRNLFSIYLQEKTKELSGMLNK